MKPWMWILVVVLIGGGALVGSWYESGREPRRVEQGPLELAEDTTRILEPLTQDGLPDYVAALNAGEAPPPEHNAAIPLLRIVGTRALAGNVPEILRRLGAPDDLPIDPAFQRALLDLDVELDQAQEKLEDEPDELEGWAASEELLAWFEVNRAPLDALVEATNRPRLWWPIGVNPAGGVIDTVVPANGLEPVVKALQVRAALAAFLGDVERGWRDVAALLRLHRLGMQLPGSLAKIVARSHHQKAIAWVRYVLQRQSPNADLARRMLRVLIASPAPQSTLRDLDEFDRYMLLESFLRQVGAANVGSALHPALRAINQAVDDVVDLLREPDGGTLEALEQHLDAVQARLKKMAADLDTPLGKLEHVQKAIVTGGEHALRLTGEMLASMATVTTPYVFRSVYDAETNRNVAIVAIALRIHALDRGSFPESLDALVPAVLEALPRGSLDGEGVPYARTEDGCLVGAFDDERSWMAITLKRQ